MAYIGNFNANDVEPSSAYQSLPPGVYRVMVTKASEKQTKTGYMMDVLELAVCEGEYSNSVLFENLNFRHPSEQVKEIAFRTLSAICRATGKLQLSDTQELVGLSCYIDVSVKQRKDDPSKTENKIRYVYEADELQRLGVASVPQRQQPQQPPAAVNHPPQQQGGGSLPWNR